LTQNPGDFSRSVKAGFLKEPSCFIMKGESGDHK
jgi:hypothetical protein